MYTQFGQAPFPEMFHGTFSFNLNSLDHIKSIHPFVISLLVLRVYTKILIVIEMNAIRAYSAVHAYIESLQILYRTTK